MARVKRAKKWKKRKRRGRLRFRPRLHVLPDPRLYDAGFDKGHDEGYDKGFNEGFRKGRDQGLYEGADAVIDDALPKDEILFGIPARPIVEAGVAQFRGMTVKLLGVREVSAKLQQALRDKKPFSLVRLGDGELLVLAQDTVWPVGEVVREGTFLSYAGVNVPDLQARDLLLESVRRAKAVGIPRLRMKTFQPLAHEIFRYYGLPWRKMLLTDSLINYHLHKCGYLQKLLDGQKVLLAGNRARELGTVLSVRGVHVSGVVDSVNGIHDVPRIMEQIRRLDFDIALVSAGIAAVVLAERIGTELGKVAIDFGHLADSLIEGKRLW